MPLQKCSWVSLCHVTLKHDCKVVRKLHSWFHIATSSDGDLLEVQQNNRFCSSARVWVLHSKLVLLLDEFGLVYYRSSSCCMLILVGMNTFWLLGPFVCWHHICLFYPLTWPCKISSCLENPVTVSPISSSVYHLSFIILLVIMEYGTCNWRNVNNTYFTFRIKMENQYCRSLKKNLRLENRQYCRGVNRYPVFSLSVITSLCAIM